MGLTVPDTTGTPNDPPDEGPVFRIVRLGPRMPGINYRYGQGRKTAGYFRFDTPAGREALAEVYTYLCPLNNYGHPSFRLDYF